MYADDGLLLFDEDSGDFTFFCNGMGILRVDRNNINLDNNFDEDDPNTLILIRLLVWHSKFKKRKAIKKKIMEELMPIVWHPKTWWNFCMSEYEKKEVKPVFTE